jgi:hypothetical protein
MTVHAGSRKCPPGSPPSRTCCAGCSPSARPTPTSSGWSWGCSLARGAGDRPGLALTHERVFAQYADRSQLDLVVYPATVFAGSIPDVVVLYDPEDLLAVPTAGAPTAGAPVPVPVPVACRSRSTG